MRVDAPKILQKEHVQLLLRGCTSFEAFAEELKDGFSDFFGQQ
jgi:hypothetical protein